MPHKLTRDERAALNLRLPFPVSNIISSSMEEFGEMLNTWYFLNWGVFSFLVLIHPVAGR